MKKILLGATALALVSGRALAADHIDNINLNVSINSSLGISVSPSNIGLGASYNLGGSSTVVTQTIAVTNATNGVSADLQLSASPFGEADGQLTLETTDDIPDQDEVLLKAVFVSPGMRNLTTGDFDVASDSVTGSGLEAQGAIQGTGTCAASYRYCVHNGAVYPSATVGASTVYLGDGQNLTTGEVVSLVLRFTPPPSMSFEASNLTATLTVIASAAGSEE